MRVCLKSLTLLILLSAAFVAKAQSINIDLNEPTVPPEAGGGAPSSAFGGAAASPGFWNAVDAIGPRNPVPLTGLDGRLTSAFIQATGGLGASGGYNNSSNTGDYALLLNDFAEIGGAGPENDYHFTGIRPGRYLIYTYAVDPAGQVADVRVIVPGADVPLQHVTGPMPGNQFILGVTHSVHQLTLTGDVFEIDVHGPYQYGRCNGFQIVAVPEPGGRLVWALGFVGLGFRRLRKRRSQSRLS